MVIWKVLSVLKTVLRPRTSTVAVTVIAWPILMPLMGDDSVKVMVAWLVDVVAVVFCMVRMLFWMVAVPWKPVVWTFLAVKLCGSVMVTVPCSRSFVELRLRVTLSELPGWSLVFSMVRAAVTLLDITTTVDVRVLFCIPVRSPVADMM